MSASQQLSISSVPSRRAHVAPPSPSRISIEDLSVDGTFPADGYAERMESWARSVTQERAASPA
jgi:hypothetical protein